MYVAMEVLKQLSNVDYALSGQYIIKAPNDVDKMKQINNDPWPLLKAGDTVTVNYLLDLMITGSDNSAANCLIDIASRDSINKTMHKMGWYGSEVTSKFLSRKLEDPAMIRLWLLKRVHCMRRILCIRFTIINLLTHG